MAAAPARMALVFTPARLVARSEFYHQLGSLTAAGLVLTRVCEQLHRNPPNREVARVAAQVGGGLQQGLTVAEAFARCPGFAPAFDLALIDAGERSGRLEAVFKLLAQLYAARAALFRTVLAQLAYPVFIAHVAILIFPTSRLVGLLDAGGGTRFVLQKLAVLLPVYGLAALAVVASQGNRGENWRALFERFTGLIPLLGTARRDLALARFATALEALLNAGVNIVQALPLAGRASGSPRLNAAVQRSLVQVEAGRTPAEVFAALPVFPELFANLFSAGEISGKLDETLARLAAHYHEEGTRKLRAFAFAAGHTLQLLIMLGIAWQVIAFYLGYFQQIDDAMK
jgi:type II secretory pathway component PulF